LITGHSGIIKNEIADNKAAKDVIANPLAIRAIQFVTKQDVILEKV